MYLELDGVFSKASHSKKKKIYGASSKIIVGI